MRARRTISEKIFAYSHKKTDRLSQADLSNTKKYETKKLYEAVKILNRVTSPDVIFICTGKIPNRLLHILIYLFPNKRQCVSPLPLL